MCSGERAFKFTRNFYKYLNLSSQSSHGGGKAHVSVLSHFMGWRMRPRDRYTCILAQALMLRRTLCWFKALGASFLKYFHIYEQEALLFHCARVPANYEAGLAQKSLPGSPEGTRNWSSWVNDCVLWLRVYASFFYPMSCVHLGTYDLAPSLIVHPPNSPKLYFSGSVSKCLSIFACDFCLGNFDFCLKNKSIWKLAYLWFRQTALLISVHNNFLVVAVASAALHIIFIKQA